MDRLYYQPNHLWKGKAAVKKLAELSGEKPKVIKQWLSRQAFWQVHLPAPKCIDRPQYQVTTPNEMHQFYLLYMPSDTIYDNKYKYILAGIDATSRFKVRFGGQRFQQMVGIPMDNFSDKWLAFLWEQTVPHYWLTCFSIPTKMSFWINS